MRKLTNIVIYKGNICRVHSNIAPDTTHCNSHKSLFQRWGIVDSIPDHADREMLLLEVFDPGKFFFRQAVRVNLIDVQKRTNVCGGIFVISGEKNRGDTRSADRINGSGSIFPQGV